jgi:hypothetical protein
MYISIHVHFLCINFIYASSRILRFYSANKYVVAANVE